MESHLRNYKTLQRRKCYGKEKSIYEDDLAVVGFFVVRLEDYLRSERPLLSQTVTHEKNYLFIPFYLLTFTNHLGRIRIVDGKIK